MIWECKLHILGNTKDLGGIGMNQNLATEKQNVEFKESWRDEYLKWICGFANAQGGTLYIGVKDNGVSLK